MTAEEKKALIDEVSTQASKAASAAVIENMTELEKKAKAVAEESVKGAVTKETYDAFVTAQKETTEKMDGIIKEQGLQLTALKFNGNGGGFAKDLVQLMEEDKAELKQIFDSRTGVKEYMMYVDKDGNIQAKPLSNKSVASVTGTIGNLGGAGNVASVTQALTGASILRLGADANIVNQYRNTPWIFDLVNTQTAAETEKLAFWFDETTKQGASANVAEGGIKPTVQYAYNLNASNWKKEAQLISFTQEFDMDFPRLQQNIMEMGRKDLINRVNSAILPNIIAAATVFAAGGYVAPPTKGRWDAIAAMAAQVETATFAPLANAAIMSTRDKYILGTQKQSTTNGWLNAPDVLKELSIVGNPAMAAGNLVVGDFKSYNVLLRGGLIVRIGYNGTDFAQNQYSVVIEQAYFDYISTARTPGIVSGP